MNDHEANAIIISLSGLGPCGSLGFLAGRDPFAPMNFKPAASRKRPQENENAGSRAASPHYARIFVGEGPGKNPLTKRHILPIERVFGKKSWNLFQKPNKMDFNWVGSWRERRELTGGFTSESVR